MGKENRFWLAWVLARRACLDDIVEAKTLSFDGEDWELCLLHEGDVVPVQLAAQAPGVLCCLPVLVSSQPVPATAAVLEKKDPAASPAYAGHLAQRQDRIGKRCTSRGLADLPNSSSPPSARGQAGKHPLSQGVDQ